jgi:DNA-directed RNA polymerase subunit M/transcription elongation factor TFIIS
MNPKMSFGTGLRSPVPPCPKCGTYLFMPHEIDGEMWRKCGSCGHKKRVSKRWYEIWK